MFLFCFVLVLCETHDFCANLLMGLDPLPKPTHWCDGKQIVCNPIKTSFQGDFLDTDMFSP